MILKGQNRSDDHEDSLIFVSYARADDQPSPGADEGWVTTLVKKLKTLLVQKLGRQIEFSMQVDSYVQITPKGKIIRLRRQIKEQQQHWDQLSEKLKQRGCPHCDLISQLCDLRLVSKEEERLFTHDAGTYS